LVEADRCRGIVHPDPGSPASGDWLSLRFAIDLQTGDAAGAVARLDSLLHLPGGALTRAWLRIDPTFAPLKGNPRFELLVTGK